MFKFKFYYESEPFYYEVNVAELEEAFDIVQKVISTCGLKGGPIDYYVRA